MYLYNKTCEIFSTLWLYFNMGFVYLIKDASNHTYKIGVSRAMDVNNRRIRSLQTGNSTELQVMFMYNTLYPFRMESMLHKRYEQYQVLNEWYDLPEEDVANFLNTCSDLDVVINSLKDNPYFNKKLK